MRLANPLRRRRPPDDSAETLRRIRGHDLSSHSDGDLRDALASIRSSIASGDRAPDHSLHETFALVSESISRRLGAWRLFDPARDEAALSPYREMAAHIVEAGPYRSLVGYYTDQDFLETPAFRRSLGPLLDELCAGGDERTIVATMVYVAEASKVRYEWDILLPAEFYRALRAGGLASALSFHATDEQLLAGLLLYQGRVVEMDAGEGKTVAAAFPAVMHAVAGRPVHVITANDYLAGRDAEWLAPVYESLGMGVRALLSHMSDTERRDAYRGQAVYGTLREFGFDFLRDNLRYSSDEMVQGPLDVAIVDEADQTLIDESRTPLIIAGKPAGNRRSVHKVKGAVEELIARQATLVAGLEERLAHSDLGEKELRRTLATLYVADPENATVVEQFARDSRLRRRVQAAVGGASPEELLDTLCAELLYTLDLRRQQVTLTEGGQFFLERRLGHVFDTGPIERELEAAESNEDPTPLVERRQVGEKLRRRLSRQYGQISQVHTMLHAYLLLARDVDYMVTEGRVVLIDAVTGRGRPDSRYQHGLQNALEAKEGLTVQPETEALAQISVQGFMRQYSHVAGMTGTAMAARDEFRRAYGLDVVAVPPTRPSKRTDLPAMVYATHQDKLQAVLDEVKACHAIGRPVLVGTRTVEQSEEISRLLSAHGVDHRLLNAVNNAEEAEVVRSAGTYGAVTVATNMAGRGTDIVLEPGLGLGLHVIGTEMNESSRIDAQLRGRSARQGEQGSFRPILSLEDRSLAFTVDGGTATKREATRDLHGGVYLQGRRTARLLAAAQALGEQDDEVSRGVIWDYNRVIEQQTLSYYRDRSQIMESDSFHPTCLRFVRDRARRMVDMYLPPHQVHRYASRFEAMAEELWTDYGVDAWLTWGLGTEALKQELERLMTARLDDAMVDAPDTDFERVEKLLFLQTADELWVQHLSDLHGIMTGTALCTHGHEAAVAEFVMRCVEARRELVQDVVDAFLPRLLAFTAETDARPESADVILVENVHEILV